MNTFSLRRKTVLITGAASGIGKSLAFRLAQEGCNLILIDINLVELEKVGSSLMQFRTLVDSFAIDVSKPAQINELALQLQDRTPIDVLINNAGVALWGTFEETPEIDFNWLFNINFGGTVNMCRAFLPQLKKREQAHIVNISSIWGIVSPAGQVAYSASKFAIKGFSDSLREELRLSNISVALVHPGGVATQIAHNAKAPDNFTNEAIQDGIRQTQKVLTLSPEVAADRIVKGIIKRKKRILIGKDAKAIAFMYRLFPGKHMDFVRKLL